MRNSKKQKVKFRMMEGRCEICGEPFRRSGNPDAPPRFCGRNCYYEWRMGKAYDKFIIPDEKLPEIRAMYAKGVGKGEVSALAKKLGVPRQKITNIARSKGWIPKNHSKDWNYHWCDREDDIILKFAHCAPITVKRRMKSEGYERSISAIEIRRTKLRAVKNCKGMTAYQVSDCLGIDVHVVLSAIKRGKLKALKKPGYTGDKAPFLIMDRDIREYIVNHVPEVNFGKVDKYWLVDLLTNSAAGSQA